MADIFSQIGEAIFGINLLGMGSVLIFVAIQFLTMKAFGRNIVEYSIIFTVSGTAIIIFVGTATGWLTLQTFMGILMTLFVLSSVMIYAYTKKQPT